jgi:hypothetical protein
MVKTANDILDINPLERMDKLDEITYAKKGTIAAKRKELEEFEKTKKIEIEELDNKKRKELEDLDKRKQKDLSDLDQKRKELHELESRKIKEIEETQKLIDQSFQDLMRHKRIILQEEDEIKVKSKNKEDKKDINLEDVANTAPKIIPEGVNSNYSKFFENFQEPKRLYDVTNNAFYSGLTELRNRAASGQITPEEELFVERLKNQFEQFNNNQVYVERDENKYVKRSMQIIDQIGKYQRLKID